MKLNKFAYLYSKPLGNHTLKIMKKIPGNLLKNLEKSWKYPGILSTQKVGTLVPVEGGGVDPQVNKFEQASNDDHQLSVVGGRSPGLMSKGGGEGVNRSPGVISEGDGVHCHVTYPMMHELYLSPPPPPQQNVGG